MMDLKIQKRMLSTIPLLEVVPEKHKNDRMPLIIFYHGWQLSKEMILTQGRYLAQEGFRVILPDAENHGERKREMTNIPSLTFWQSIHTNLFEFGYIVDHFQRLGLADDRIGVGGLSMGGITTCALLTQHPEITAAACLMGSPKPVEYRDRIAQHASHMDIFFPKDYENLLKWIPEYDLSLNPETLNGRPLFFWHGQQDNVVPYDHVVEFVEENKDKKNIEFIDENERHLVKVDTMKQAASFFAREML